MKILVTGATSSIGAYVVKYLIEEGHIVHILVRKKENASLFHHQNVVPFEGDILDKKSLNIAIQECEQVYHLAAIAKVWLKKPSVFFETNVEGTANVLDVAYQNKVSKVVVTSSAGVYGPSTTGIITENKIREIDFFNEYESSKTLAELKIKEYVIEKKLNVVIVSPTRVYGPLLFGIPASTNLLIDKFLNKNWRILPGTGKEIGNYAFIEDVAKGHILAMKKGIIGQTYILGGENYTYSDFYKILAKKANSKRKMLVVPFWLQKIVAKIQLFRAEIFGSEPSITPKWLAKAFYNWEVSSNKAIVELGYEITNLEEGIEKTINYLKK